MEKNKEKKSLNTILIIIFIVYITIFGIIFGCNYGVRTNTHGVTQFCYDYHDIFTSEEEKDINKTCKSIQKLCGVNVFVATSDRTEVLWGETFINRLNFKNTDDLIVLIINCYKRETNNYIEYYDYHFDLYAYGNCYSKITTHEINELLYSKAGDNLLVGDKTTTKGAIKMVKNLAVAYKLIYSNWLVPSIIGFIPAFITLLVIILKTKSKYKIEQNINNFSLKNNSTLNLTTNTDEFLFSTIDKYYDPIVESSSDSDSSSSSSSSSGDSSSGGGGGSGHLGGR